MKANNSHLTSLVLIFLFVIVSCTFVSTWFTKGCLIFDCPPKRNFTVFDMNIPSGYLPNNLDIKLRPDKGMLNAVEESHGGAEWQNGYAVYIVLKFGAENQAKEWFIFKSQQNFFYPNLPIASEKEDILRHLMLSADQYEIQCGYDISQNFRCVFYARYQEFYIFFNSSIDEVEFTKINFIDLISYVDLQMNKLLSE
jgi:hypothetical protein